MVKRKRGNNSIMLVISAVLFLFGLSFLLFPERSFTSQVQIYAVASLIIGVIYMAFASTSASAHGSGEWTMIEGLMDILLGIVLIMSINTAHTGLLLIFFAIWALMGFLARLFYALRAQNSKRRNGILNAAFCLAACLLFASSVFLASVPLSVLLGAGLLLYSAGSFAPPRPKHSKPPK